MDFLQECTPRRGSHFHGVVVYIFPRDSPFSLRSLLSTPRQLRSGSSPSLFAINNRRPLCALQRRQHAALTLDRIRTTDSVRYSHLLDRLKAEDQQQAWTSLWLHWARFWIADTTLPPFATVRTDTHFAPQPNSHSSTRFQDSRCPQPSFP